MFLDFEDHRPEEPRVTSAISRREGVLLSLLFHAVLVILWLVSPRFGWVEASPMIPAQTQPDVKFVHMVPLKESLAPPRPRAEQSDLDRRATSPEAAPVPQNEKPFSRGDTPEKVIGAPGERPAGPDTPVPVPSTNAAPPDAATRIPTESTPLVAPRPETGGLGNSLRNLQKFLQKENYENPQGGQADQSTDIQFDSKGVEFGPWLRRFVAQVKRNWYVPQAAMTQRGRVVITFWVHKNGALTDIQVITPSSVISFNNAAASALRLSNPTLALPPEFPDDKVFFTVTFHYNEGLAR